MRNEKREQRRITRTWADRLAEELELFYLRIVSGTERACFLAASRTKRACGRAAFQLRRNVTLALRRSRKRCRRVSFRLRFLLRSRAANVQRMAVQTVALAVLFLVLTGLVFGIAHRVSAREQHYAKYVTSITIEDGDSLWRIAERYMTDGYTDIPTFIEEIRSCNNLYGDEIHAGEKLIVPYFVPVH